MNIIEINKLTKAYGKHQALRGVDLSVKEGEVMGFLGPNGAGKSTTIRILLGLIRKSGGEVRVFGRDPWNDAAEIHRRIAYVPGDVTLWPNLTGGEVIDLLGRMRGGFDIENRNKLLQRFELDPRKKCRTYSKGNRQKVALVSAFSSNAELFIFDEPTTGLDPLMAAVFGQCVAELKKAGKTVLLSSHILAEVEAVCDKVSIIRNGEIIESGTLAELRHFTRTTVAVETSKPISGLEGMTGIHNLSVEGLRANFQVDAGELDRIMQQVTSFGLRSLTSTPPTLEELFMSHYSNDSGQGKGNKAGGGKR
ncbi:ABC transporter ATP-binding protein [Geosporobacter ferrireducens]|uniref:ABC transporter ATP-binding protein n=1 Tax=Geosporobacter ferrireducens TaxID=1424294 RepID=A0A1D8GI50_9FIRM|nr:ABC transporter ATP-binding protein [Geosporobacter ferrireducens]AOT70601.1 ABC transporter ATP-binding protein [Geosporobacter ferrireducens]